MKRAKFESVFITQYGTPIRATFDYMKEYHIIHVLIPWFQVAKHYKIPKDMVKMIARMLKSYYECPLWKTIKEFYSGCYQCVVVNAEKYFNFYANLVKELVHCGQLEICYGRRMITITSIDDRHQLVLSFHPCHIIGDYVIDLLKNE